MFNIVVFLKIFCPVFLVVASVGPCFLTYANISMNHGYKKGFTAALGCFTVDILYIIFGIFAIKTVKTFVPDFLILALGLFAGCFLLYIAHGFWTTTEKSLTIEKVENNYLMIYLKLLCLTISSPIAIIGYASIFSAIDNVSSNIVSIFLGACSAALVAHSLIVVTFATIGKKIDLKTLIFLNKVSAIVIGIFACKIIWKIVKTIFL